MAAWASLASTSARSAIAWASKLWRVTGEDGGCHLIAASDLVQHSRETTRRGGERSPGVTFPAISGCQPAQAARLTGKLDANVGVPPSQPLDLVGVSAEDQHRREDANPPAGSWTTRAVRKTRARRPGQVLIGPLIRERAVDHHPPMIDRVDKPPPADPPVVGELAHSIGQFRPTEHP
jgi:hypothetical protein